VNKTVNFKENSHAHKATAVTTDDCKSQVTYSKIVSNKTQIKNS
jgi:hypothetical protein